MRPLRRLILTAALLLAAGTSNAETEPMPGVVQVLDLKTAQKIALSENPSLRSAAARIQRAEARLDEVESTYWPTIGLGASARHNRRSDNLIQEIEDARIPFADGYEDRVAQAMQDNFNQLSQATDTATRRVRVDRLRQLEGYPALIELQKAAYAETDRQRKIYLNTLESQLSDFTPVQSVVEALGIDEELRLEDSVESYRAGAYGTWLLFDGFARRHGQLAARFGRDGSEEARRDAQRILLGAVARAYYQAQLVREEVVIAEADLDFNARLLDEASKRRDVGQVSLSTVLNFEVRRNLAEISMVNAKRKYDANRVALAALMGYPEAYLPDDVELAPLEDERPEQLNPPDPSLAIGYALANRTDVASARYALEQARSAARLARSAYMPTLNLTGDYSANRIDDASFEEDDFGGSVGLVLTYELFGGGERRARVREAMAAEAEAEAVLDQTELTTASEVRSAIVTLSYAGELLQLQRDNLALIQQTRDLVELEYKARQESLVRLNEAQRDLVLARSRYATALASLHVAWNDLLQSTAQSLESIDP